MVKPNIQQVIVKSKAIIHSGRYAYLKTTDKKLNNHFLLSQDNDEITIITEENNVELVKYSEIVKWFKLIEIIVAIPFYAGFLSKIIKPIADAGYNTLIISTFSKDYILTKEQNIKEVAKILKDTGLKVIFN